MITFRNNQNQYVPSVDLTTLGNTFNTLEQGHKEAIKAASDLEITMAKFELNEAEDEWRQNKINEIKQTIADNTVYGNAYGALDNIIMKAGNLASDQGMIGRIKAQKDYKTFEEQIKNDKTLPQNYKDYYLENNKYYYKDIKDKNGNIISGTKWNPTVTPTNIIPLSDLVVKGISIAAKESGGGDITRWLDVDGRVTTDPTKAFDGEVYNTTTNKWERLSKDKIMQATIGLIETTPGAKESLKQDYDISVWEHDKNVKANNNNPIISDVTDDNGILLSEDQYLFKRINPIAQAASYYNSISSTSYGKGLATYNAARAKAIENASNGDLSDRYNITDNTMSTKNTAIEIYVPQASNFLAARNNSENMFKSLYESLTGKNDLIKLDSKQVDDIISQIDKNPLINTDAKYKLKQIGKTFKEAELNLEAYTKDMSTYDKNKFLFATRMQAGGELISSKNGGTKEDDKIINAANRLLGKNGQTIVVNLSDKTVSQVDNIINGNTYSGYANLGIVRVGNTIRIPREKISVVPMIASIVSKAENKANAGFTSSIYQFITNDSARFSIDVLDSNGRSIYDKDKHTLVQNGNFGGVQTAYDTGRKARIHAFRQIGSIYDDAISTENKLRNKYNVAPSKITVDALNFDGKSFTEAALLDDFNKGLISETEYEKNKQYYNDSFDRIIPGHDFANTTMYYDNGKGVKTKISDSKKRFELGNTIKEALKDKRVIISPGLVPGITDPVTGAPSAGYNVTVMPKTDKNGKPIDGAKEETYYIPGLVNETASQMIMNSTGIKTYNQVIVAGGTKSTRILTDNNISPILGEVSITGLRNNTYKIKFAGLESICGQQEAVSFTQAINDYNACKDRFISSGNNQLTTAQRNTIANAAITIGTTYGVSPNAVLESLMDDINK